MMKQELIIKKQGRVIDTLGGNYEAYDQTFQKEKFRSQNFRNQLQDQAEAINISDIASSINDSALGESSEDTFIPTMGIDERLYNKNTSDHSDAENSDSYVTITDDSSGYSENDSESQTEEVREDRKYLQTGLSLSCTADSLVYNPYFEQGLENTVVQAGINDMRRNCKNVKLHGQVPNKGMKEENTILKKNIVQTGQIEAPPHELRKQKEDNVSDIVPEKVIGNPEDMNINGQRLGVLQKSFRLFRRSKQVNEPRLWKSTSEGNLKETVNNEKKPSYFQTLRQGIKRRSRKQESKLFYQSTPCLANIEPGFETWKSADVPAYPYLEDMGSLPLFFKTEGETMYFYEPHSYNVSSGSKPLMPNHKNVQRPRDVKNKSHRKCQNTSRFHSLL